LIKTQTRQKSGRQTLIGLIPAAGTAERLSPLPFSKELYPIGYMRRKECNGIRCKPICIYLLERMKKAGVSEAFIVLRKGKWDIPGYLGDGSGMKLNLAYAVMKLPYGVPFTLKPAIPFIRDKNVVFGFPDIIFEPDNAFLHLLERLEKSNADIVLGLFPESNPSKNHMVDMASDGRIKKIVMNHNSARLQYTWIIAVWSKSFTQYIDAYLKSFVKSGTKSDLGNEKRSEVYLTQVIQNAIESSLDVQGVAFPKGKWLDIGTPENLVKGMQWIDQGKDDHNVMQKIDLS
jgi:glucose-1-phosphate thymidylyltransferase